LAKVLKINRDEMIETAVRILRLVGSSEANAVSVAESLVLAQESGHTSHGVMRLSEYVEFVGKGQVNPSTTPIVASDRGAVVNLDGQWGWGQVACKKAVELVAEKANNLGIATVAINSCNHIGRLGEYVEMLSKRSLIAIMFCNTGPSVAAHGGTTRLFGTNPFAAAIPAEDGDIVIDFATAASAEGKLRIAHSTGVQVPQGLVITKDGVPTTDPGAFYEGGALLPFGGHKGYCLSLLIDLLGGGLSGIHPAMNSGYSHGNGTVLIAMNPDFFVGSDNFSSDIAESKVRIKESPAANQAAPVLLPGELEENAKVINKDGIEILELVWNSIIQLEKSL
jgi:uncharacterized oxidoreductase